jgi:hypothetical protein
VAAARCGDPAQLRPPYADPAPQVHTFGNTKLRPKALRGTVRRTRHQACEIDGTDKAEKLIQRPAPSLTQQQSA